MSSADLIATLTLLHRVRQHRLTEEELARLAERDPVVAEARAIAARELQARAEYEAKMAELEFRMAELDAMASSDPGAALVH